MHFIWHLLSLVATVVLSLPPLNKAAHLAMPSHEDQLCHISHKTALCYVQCFEDIASSLPPEIDRSLIKHLIVYQKSSVCHLDMGMEVFNEFTSLQKLHYTGALCPFSVLPNLTNMESLTFSLSTNASPSREEFIWTNSTRSELPRMQMLAITEICCGLFQGTVVAPQLEKFSFRCSRVSSYISGVDERQEGLVFVTPVLKSLDYLESSSGFPVSSVSNLPSLEGLFVTINMEFTEDRVPTSKSLNLPSLQHLVVSQGEFGNIFGLNNYQCMELGDTNLRQVILMHPPSGSTTCPSIWRCIACTSSNQHKVTGTQTVNIFTRSSTTANLSSLLPNEKLNTTHLILSHAPLLQVDSEAMRRFSHLQMLQVGEISGSHQYNGLVTLLGNPFKALPRPQTFQFLLIALLKCGCEEYDTFAWLKAQNPAFEGAIYCLTVPESSIDEEQLPVNKSIRVETFLKKLSGQCVPTPVLEMVYNSTIGQFVLQPIGQPPTTTTTAATTTTTAMPTTSGAASALPPPTIIAYAILFLSLLLHSSWLLNVIQC